MAQLAAEIYTVKVLYGLFQLNITYTHTVIYCNTRICLSVCLYVYIYSIWLLERAVKFRDERNRRVIIIPWTTAESALSSTITAICYNFTFHLAHFILRYIYTYILQRRGSHCFIASICYSFILPCFWLFRLQKQKGQLFTHIWTHQTLNPMRAHTNSNNSSGCC